MVNYLTAYLHMHEYARVKSGERALIHGAAGGVGTALLELGNIVGLEMYGTASSHNHETVSALGAKLIDYRNEDFVERVRSLTGDGVDVVFDTVGGANQLLRSYQALNHDGQLVWLGSATTKDSGVLVRLLSFVMIYLLKVVPDGHQIPHCPDLAIFYRDNKSWCRETLAEILDLLEMGKINPVVAECIPLVDAAGAHELLEKGGNAGKLVLVIVY